MLLRLKWFSKTVWRKIRRFLITSLPFLRADAFGAYREETVTDEWQYVPVPGTGYVKSSEIAALSDRQIQQMIKKAEAVRWSEKSWRNDKGLFRKHSGTQSFRGKRILDFGCGLGMDSLEMLRHGNRVLAADIVPSNLKAAERVAQAHGFQLDALVQVSHEAPFFNLEGTIDIFYSNGVLHHTPKIREILQRACEFMRPEGEFRIMLYSDKGWEIATKSKVPSIAEKVTENKSYPKFVHFFDSVGHYADWYNREKLEYVLGDFLNINEVYYVTRDGRFMTAAMTRK